MAFAQNGAIIYGGIHSFQNLATQITPEGQGHNGWHGGIKARFYDGRFYFSPGINYYRTPIEVNEPGTRFQQQSCYHLLELP